MLEDIVKQSQEFGTLKREFKDGRLGTSLLLLSQDEVYLKQFCKMVASLIFDGTACGKCDNCIKVMAGAHPDLKIYPAEGKKLVVADSEEIVMESFVKPIFADKKIFILNSIDQAADVAQNKLLKILEEPPQNVYFLLTCSSIDKVLPTIRSRCQKYQLARLSDQTIVQQLPKLDPELIQNVVAVCDGQIGKAFELCQKKDFQALCQDCVDVFVKMKSSKQVLAQSKKLQEYDFLLCMQIFALICADLIKIKVANNDLVRLKNFQDQLQTVSSEYTLRALCEIAGLLDQVQKERTFNVNQTLLIENFLLNMLEVKYLCK